MTPLLPREFSEDDEEGGPVIRSLDEFNALYGSVFDRLWLPLYDEPEHEHGLLCRVECALFDRPRGAWLGNLIGDLRYWLRRVSR